MYNHMLDDFLAVAETGSFAKAGLRLHVSPTSIMKQIRALEAHLGVILFKRSVKGASLTEAGVYLYEEAKKMVRHSFMVTSQIKQVSGKKDRLIRIGISPLTPLEDFNRIWHSSPRSDQFTLSLVNYPTDLNTTISKAVEQIRNIDIGLGSEPDVRAVVPTETVVIREYHVTCAVPSSHRLSQKEQLTYEDLAGETLVLPSMANPSFANCFIQVMRKQHPEINVEAIPLLYDMELFNQCSVDGKLLLSHECWDNIHPELINIPVEWEWTRSYGLTYKKEARPEVLEFVEAFKEAADSIKANY